MKPDQNAIIRASEAGAENGATIALVAVKAISDTITFAECKKLYGEVTAEWLRLHAKIKWFPLGKGSLTSGVYAKRLSVAKILFSKKIEDCTN